MKAKLIKPEQSNGKNYGGEKEMVSALSVIGTYKGELREVVTVRCYMGRSSSAITVYASLWVHGSIHCAGHGQVGGYGYHKESAAIASAISSAGIGLFGSPYADRNDMVWIDYPNTDFDQATLDALEGEDYKRYAWRTPRTLRKLVKDTTKTEAHIGGCGDGAVESALLAIAKLAGARGKLLIVKH